MLQKRKQNIKWRWKKKHIIVAFLFTFLMSGCGGGYALTPASKTIAPKQRLDRVRFTIQVGAFENLDNAVRFTEHLQNRGLDAYHFVDSSGLYKVRFGNYPTKKSARQTATRLQSIITLLDPSGELVKHCSEGILSEQPKALLVFRTNGADRHRGKVLIAAA
jgi:hypothetical protein